MMMDESALNIYQIAFHNYFIDIYWKKDLLPVKKIGFSTLKTDSYSSDLNPAVFHLVENIRNYLSGKKVSFTTEILDLSGISNFSASVLKELSEVKYGDVISYRELSEKCGTSAVRAVGSVMAKNRFPLVYPCHRVIRSTGEIGQFAGGTELKKLLLETEGLKFISADKILINN
ncbi:MAG: MGMT family protein [Spirochaetes bacterium]|nr:MGMT family protein [Spirochaetota bacterium]